ncbi:glycosyltransferase [Psychroserpens algicola]|uniref:Glycosyltransferase n=1 Tax=Psychroserpens algicola TaxID=1719034 RepID=A0ABT0H581_9FLAO|nr:glycosyltransferase [Psychroserpens algicola]MCK8479551.1 glycosyltransferase [Psychroserpens algicola]
MKVLTIISHTEHYKNANGTIVGLGSTVTEINHLVSVFDEIRHIAMLHDVEVPPSALPYTSDKIKFIPIEAVGGSSFTDKFAIVKQAPKVIKTIKYHLKDSDYFQFRAPTGIGVFVIPYLTVFSSKPGWFKYAGNWNQKQAPLAYRFQKWVLKQQSRTVTINGQWPDQPKHCLTFENPCLTMEEVHNGNLIAQNKTITKGTISLCFVGRLEPEKGLDLFIKALKHLTAEEKTMIQQVDVVGDGKRKDIYKKMTDDLEVDVVFHGFVSREDVHRIYKSTHAIVLPSASEGFPKVIAEALNFGCIPVVSNVSGISHYVKHQQNGFLLDTISVESIVSALKSIISLSPEDHIAMLTSHRDTIKKFTFSHYNNRIQNELIN